MLSVHVCLIITELIHCGKVMLPERTLSDYKIKNKSCVNVLVKQTEPVPPAGKIVTISLETITFVLCFLLCAKPFFLIMKCCNPIF